METRVNSTIFTEKGDADTGPSTGTVNAQAPVFTRVHQASIGLQWLMFYKHDHTVMKKINHWCTVEHRLL